jgi:hypothetical protein
MLMTFMLTPLATNGVLPVICAYILLIRYNKASFDITLLTTLCWLLSIIVYWRLYSSIIPINRDITSDKRANLAYQQFMYKLLAINECGGLPAGPGTKLRTHRISCACSDTASANENASKPRTRKSKAQTTAQRNSQHGHLRTIRMCRRLQVLA